MPIPSKDRVRNGLCPRCGREAAPYYLCHNCRQSDRITRMLKRGARHGVFQFIGGGSRLTKNTMIWKGAKFEDDGANAELRKWAIPIHMSEADGRGKPRMRGIRVDVESTLLNVVRFIGRPCTIEEIIQAWGRLRDRRESPLPNDLARIIAASDERSKKNARRAAAWEKSQRAAE